MILKPLKWLVLTGAVVGGAGFLFFGTDFPSYIGTMASSVREGVTGNIPVEFELKRAEGLIRKIEPQIESCKRDVARAEVELEELQASVAGLEKTVVKEESKLKSGARLLSGDGAAEIVLASDSRSRRRVESDLQRTMDSFKTNSSILKTKRALIDRQSQAVDVAKQRLFAVRAEKEALEDQCRQLKTQQQQIENMAASSKNFHLDDSALGAAKEVIEQIKKRLDVAQKMLENEMIY
jgi:septal ring factor EnvC (AmiA/AmiB activator)